MSTRPDACVPNKPRTRSRQCAAMRSEVEPSCNLRKNHHHHSARSGIPAEDIRPLVGAIGLRERNAAHVRMSLPAPAHVDPAIGNEQAAYPLVRFIRTPSSHEAHNPIAKKNLRSPQHARIERLMHNGFGQIAIAQGIATRLDKRSHRGIVGSKSAFLGTRRWAALTRACTL